jgi:outer membrane protein
MKSIYLAILLAGAGSLDAQSTNPPPLLTLTNAWQLALADHPRLAAANYQVLAAEESVKEARSADFPTASLYATAAGEDSGSTRILAGGINNPSVYDRLAGGLSVSQLITDFGRTANLKASSEFAAQAEYQNADTVRAQVLLQVSSTYYNTLAAQAVAQVAQETVDTRKLLLDQITALATNKLKSDLDVGFAQVAYEQGQLLLQTAQNGAAAAMASLATALGRRESQTFQLVEPPAPESATNDVEQLIQTALSRRPELLRLRDQGEAARHFAQSEKDARLPTVSALGVIGNSPLHDDHVSDNYAAADLNISLPLFSGGLYRARQHRAEFRAQADDEMLRNAEDDIIREVRLAWLNLNNIRQQLRTTEDLVKHSAEAFDLARARYEAGLSSMVELSEAQLSLTSAKISLASAHYELLARQAALAYQTGSLR